MSAPADETARRQLMLALIEVQLRMMETHRIIGTTHLRLVEAHLADSQTEPLETARELLKILTENQDALEARIKNLHKGSAS